MCVDGVWGSVWEWGVRLKCVWRCVGEDVVCGGVGVFVCVCVGGSMYLCFCYLFIHLSSSGHALGPLSPFSSSVELCVTFDASSYTVEEGKTALLKITLDQPANIPISVMVMLTDGSAVGE